MFNKVKSIAELYEEVKEFDLVITNDAPLATALNKLVDKPRLELLAMTPKQIASKFSQLYFYKIFEKYEVTLNVSKKSGMPLRVVHQIVKKIYEVWMYNAKFEFIEQFLNEEETEILDLIKEYDTIETALEFFNEDFYGNKRIAVIGQEIFSLLDLEALPSRRAPAERINVFKEEEYKIDRTHIFRTTEQLIHGITDLINNDNADETAIVIEPESEYLEILKARLNSKGINIEIKNYLSDDPRVKNLISLIELSLRIRELKVKELISQANELGISIDNRYNQYEALYLKSVYKDNIKIMSFFSIAESIAEFSYTELIKKLETDFEMKFPEEFTDVLDMLALTNNKIDSTNLIDLKYFLKEFDTELGSEKSGVLFVNALSSAFIDRQIIFYTGLDNSWMKLFPDKDYLNKEEEDEKNLKRFKILLQQGGYRFYFVKSVNNYKEIIPCYYFMNIAGREISNFNDSFFNPLQADTDSGNEKYKSKRKKLNTEAIEPLKKISPSKFNLFYRCPKQYSFSLLLTQEESPVFMKGTLLHCLAEFYFNYPDFVNKNKEQILDWMSDEMLLFQKNINRQFVRSEFRLGMETIIKFLNEMNFEKIEDPIILKSEGNRMMKKFRKDKKYSNTESWLPDPENSMLTGKIDLRSGSVIVDYKSSYTRKSETNVSMQSNTVYIEKEESEEFDFQAAAYMTSLSRYLNEITFIYNYLFSDISDQINGNSGNTRTVIKYKSVAFEEYIYSNEFFTYVCEKHENANRFCGKTGYENFKNILKGMNMEDTDYYDKQLIEARFIESAFKVMEETNLTYSDFGNRSADTFMSNYLNKISGMIYNVRIGKTETGLIFKDDVENFKELVTEKLKELNKYMETDFPADPVFESIDVCRKCDFLNLCQGNKLWH